MPAPPSQQSYFPLPPSTHYTSTPRSSIAPSYSPYQVPPHLPIESAGAGPSYYNYGGGSGQGSSTGYGVGSGSGSAGSGGVGAPDQETFEFMKRKKWPQLLMQELIGAAVWCLVPYQPAAGSLPGPNHSGWKIVFASPATTELLGYRPDELENRDWGDIIFPLDLPRLLHSISSTITPTYTPPLLSPGLTYQTSNSRTSSSELDPSPSQMDSGGERFVGPARPMSVYTRMVGKDGRDVLFELRGHAHHVEEDNTPATPASEINGGFDGGGIMGLGGMYPTSSTRGSISAGGPGGCKAFWVMGRKWSGQGDSGVKMLDSFLELKMENERLRQELKALQGMPGDGRSSISSSTSRPAIPFPSYNPGYMVSSSYDRSAGDAYNLPSGGEDSDDDAMSVSPPPKNHGGAGPSGGGAGGGVKEEKKPKKNKQGKVTEYLCRNCGRNDSPEWRKGPLGAKTLCNACGLRWAKRNAGPPTKKKDKEKEGGNDDKTSSHFA